MAFAAARMIKEKAKRPSMDLALYPVSNIFIAMNMDLIFLPPSAPTRAGRSAGNQKRHN